MPTTDNHDIEIPPAGDEQWAAKLTRNLDAFETTLPLFAPTGSLDSSVVDDPHTPHQDAWVLASDSGAIFAGDGSSWNYHGGIVMPASASATGDGTTTDFTLVHDLGTTPEWVGVTPTTSAAAAPHHVAGRTATDLTLSYTDPPADGAALEWDLGVVADGGTV